MLQRYKVITAAQREIDYRQRVAVLTSLYAVFSPPRKTRRWFMTVQVRGVEFMDWKNYWVIVFAGVMNRLWMSDPDFSCGLLRGTSGGGFFVSFQHLFAPQLISLKGYLCGGRRCIYQWAILISRAICLNKSNKSRLVKFRAWSSKRAIFYTTENKENSTGKRPERRAKKTRMSVCQEAASQEANIYRL